ncbi:MAG: hypothetical protein PWR20_1416 [Bacteroidales bacterium]|jgi:ribulose kinase|nr:hypothetical protein [Bacteroidales bacterium]MDN5329658.1 hypothetical protein [Bacteroidales bacterium]
MNIFQVNKRKFLQWVSLLFLLGVAIIISLGCHVRKSQAERQQKAIEKRKEENRKKEMARYEAKRRRHEQLQGAEGKRLLKNAKKHTQKLDKASAPKTFFLWRWLGIAPRDKNACAK